ncbi:fasciclin domain-containing protein [Winogradskyella flava]|uniref:fasciclin domain-containing protein n=1 Tax=Winogradskyella flava TaxID=1884876 RepID=UPI002493A0A4|nr:fasciclin domain-containing protein [Winogradskyella flava]
MKIISKNFKLLSVFLLVLGITGCSDDDDGNPQPTVCTADAGTLTATTSSVSLSGGTATISATANGDIVIPANYDVTYVLTSGTNLVIEDAGANPSFTVDEAGLYTIHTLVAETSDNTDANFLDLSVINFGTTTGGDVLGLVTSNNLCASLDVTGAPVQVTFTVVDLAINAGFTSLAAALTATDLVSVLQGDGPFTVFAPTNDAFTALLNATGLDLNNLSADEEALVTNILLNHVIVGSNITSSDLVSLGSGYVNTGATGPNDANLSLYFDTSNGVVLNGQSNVDTNNVDLMATNGIVHVVNEVIDLPTIATFATTNPALSTLVAALQYADTGTPTVPYIATVSDVAAGPFTVFAPVDDAFLDGTNGILAELGLSGFGEGTGELNAATTDAVLLMHIVSGNIQSSELPNGTVGTLGGDITADNTNFTLTDANSRVSNIVTSLVDIQAVNGVVHVIDKVILPAQ